MSHSRTRIAPERHRGLTRRGAALVVALALIVLATALLAGTSAAVHFSARSATAREAAILAQARVSVDIARFIAAWSAECDSLAPGAELAITVGPETAGSANVPVVTHLRLRRLASRRYVLGATTQIGADDAVLARRRASVILESPPVTDSTSPRLLPILISQWTLHRLY